MRINTIRQTDISNGKGLRVSIFLQGCSLGCKGCFNKELWDYKGGVPFTDKHKKIILELLGNPHIRGLSVLGGEPLSYCNLIELEDFLSTIKKHYPNKDIWLWTGFSYETLSNLAFKVLQWVDVLIDGRYIEELYSPDLFYRGSANQRVIYLQ